MTLKSVQKFSDNGENAETFNDFFLWTYFPVLKFRQKKIQQNDIPTKILQ